jgi:peptidoglycan/xylan/chitin deacetylase (PgdA/CDA1 family)
MKRRKFFKDIALGAAAVSLGALSRVAAKNKITHVLTLSFDDGFKKSFSRTAEIFEKFKLPGCFNVIASAHLPEYRSPNEYMESGRGDFKLWNDLVRRGHEVMPHGWAHENLKERPIDEAKGLINKSIQYFSENLEGFDPQKAVFNFPYNASTPELNEWTVTQVRAVRTIVRGNPVNPMPGKNVRIIDCNSHGPDNIDRTLDEQINRFLGSEGGWFVFNTHGLDEEGWGPMTSAYLEKLLARLTQITTLEILPAGMALEKYSE